MAKTKYFAVDSLGNTHTRTSARVYTHVVVVSYDQTKRRAAVNSAKNRKTYESNHAFYCREAASEPMKNHGEASDYRRKCKELAAMSCDDYVNACIARELARVDATGAGDFEDEFGAAGWCGRFDLAQKLAAKFAGVAKVEILEAQTK
ncbi:hypothetical protein SUSUWATARI_00280 [Serratia phage vB_SmaM-Susuwatari]|nr:hypothetical protein SUSUWATARI_00280 [Serratia phage vB_SmaM-Susuwatari]